MWKRRLLAIWLLAFGLAFGLLCCCLLPIARCLLPTCRPVPCFLVIRLTHSWSSRLTIYVRAWLPRRRPLTLAGRHGGLSPPMVAVRYE